MRNGDFQLQSVNVVLEYVIHIRFYHYEYTEKCRAANLFCIQLQHPSGSMLRHKH